MKSAAQRGPLVDSQGTWSSSKCSSEGPSGGGQSGNMVVSVRVCVQ